MMGNNREIVNFVSSFVDAKYILGNDGMARNNVAAQSIQYVRLLRLD